MALWVGDLIQAGAVVWSAEVEVPLEFGVDLNASRFVDGVKETANGQVCRTVVLWQASVAHPQPLSYIAPCCMV